MPQTADLNLLLGIRALQTDFVTRDALIAAMLAWSDAKHRPLEDILVDQGALDPAYRDLLRPMVAPCFTPRIGTQVVTSLKSPGRPDRTSTMARAATPMAAAGRMSSTAESKLECTRSTVRRTANSVPPGIGASLFQRRGTGHVTGLARRQTQILVQADGHGPGAGRAGSRRRPPWARWLVTHQIRTETQRKKPSHARTMSRPARVIPAYKLNPAAQPAVRNRDSPSRPTMRSNAAPR
jgi:hypothetical protein